MDVLKIDVDHMKLRAKVEGVPQLSEKLKGLGVQVDERTLYRWKRGGGFSSPKFMSAATALGYENAVVLLSVGTVISKKDKRHVCAADDCNNTVLQKPTGRTLLYCSPACKKRAYRDRKKARAMARDKLATG